MNCLRNCDLPDPYGPVRNRYWALSSSSRGLLSQLRSQRSPVLLVCEEVGLGLVAPTAIGNLFRDRMGELQQRLMSQASGSWLVVAGRALDLHALAQPVPAEI